MSIYLKNILYLIKDLRTGQEFHQVVGVTRKHLKVGSFIDVRVDFEDNPNEWVLGKVVKKTANVCSIVIVKEI